MVDGTGDTTLVGGGGADTITAGDGMDTVTLGLGKDTVIYTQALSEYDTVTDFTVADDIAALDISALNADYVVSGTASKFTTGGDADVAAGDTVVVQNVGAAANINSATNVINWTTSAADAVALETQLKRLLSTSLLRVDAGDMLVFQYNTAARAKTCFGSRCCSERNRS